MSSKPSLLGGSADEVLRVTGLSKRYVLTHNAPGGTSLHRYKRISDALLETIRAPFHRGRPSRPDSTREDFWALRDVSFRIRRGESIGIIGRNGAGKSTLLKMLSRITDPTAGRIEIAGRVASLLEVGTGFHPELSGRENIYLNGAILGMTRAEIRRRFDEIVAFAEVERFLDTPVKRYSSGMYVRLAFAVAAHLEPEILIVDEVLAVGDAQFQQKCLGRMDQASRQDGRTVLFVSHNLAAIQSLCQRCLLLQQGRLILDAPTGECIAAYCAPAGKSRNIADHATVRDRSLALTSIRVNGAAVDEAVVPPDVSELLVEIEGSLAMPMRLDLECAITDHNGTTLAYYSPGHERGHSPVYSTGGFRLAHRIGLPTLNKSELVLNLYLTDPGIRYIVEIPGAVRLSFQGMPIGMGGAFDYAQGKGFMRLRGELIRSTDAVA